jgi:hypothetical protein
MLHPYSGTLAVFPVSTVVNAGKVDDSRCLEPPDPVDSRPRTTRRALDDTLDLLPND